VTTLNFSFHERQLEIYNDPHRFKIVCCGRRFGKTRMCAYVVIIRALTKPDQVAWIVSPKYAQTAIMWRMIKKYLPRNYIKDIKEGEMVIELVNGSTIWAKSADNPDALVGEGLDLLILDEAARVKPDAWEVALQPALADRKGEAIFISTPKGKNWFYNLYLMGTNENQYPEYKSFNYPSISNTTIEDFDEEVERRRETTPELIFRQEYLAEFIEGGGEVFQDIRGNLEDSLREPVPGHNYVMGVDLAKHQDFTVVTVADISSGRIVHFDRFNKIDWNYQKDKIKYISEKYNNAVAYLDSTGVGDPIVEDLQRMDVVCYPYKFTVSSKYDLIKNMNIMLKSKKVFLPRIQVLIDEMSAYTFETLPSGVIRYSAPDGMHDDCVSSVMLTAWGLSKNRCEVVGEIPKEEVHEDLAISNYGGEDERYINWDEGDSRGSQREEILRSLHS
jgi:Terminase large subunit, T4likevirus-type, N-terminal/Terminase RNaseH-like domain